MNKNNNNVNALDNKIRLVNKRVESILKNLGSNNLLFQKYQGMIGAIFNENDTTIKINNSNYIKISRGKAINNINHNELNQRLDLILKLPTYADEKKRIKDAIKKENIVEGANQTHQNNKKTKKIKLPKITQQDIINFAKNEWQRQKAVDAALEILYNYEDTVLEAAQSIGIMRTKGKGVRTKDEIDMVLNTANNIEKYKQKAKDKNGGKLLPEPDLFFIAHPDNYSMGDYFEYLQYDDIDEALPPDRNH